MIFYGITIIIWIFAIIGLENHISRSFIFLKKRRIFKNYIE